MLTTLTDMRPSSLISWFSLFTCCPGTGYKNSRIQRSTSFLNRREFQNPCTDRWERQQYDDVVDTITDSHPNPPSSLSLFPFFWDFLKK